MSRNDSTVADSTEITSPISWVFFWFRVETEVTSCSRRRRASGVDRVGWCLARGRRSDVLEGLPLVQGEDYAESCE